jgi:hypothetical protein
MKENSKVKQSDHLGVRDFLEFINEGQPEWSLFAVEAPAEEVSEEWVDFRGAKSVSRDVPRKVAGEFDDVAPLIAVVQVKDNPWAIVFRSLLYLDEAQLEAVVDEAKEFSARLHTRTITFIGEDTSGANSYDFFEKGKLLEEAQWEVGGEFFKFKSTLRKRPEVEKVTDEFVNGFFREQGIYVPACYPMAENEDVWLAVEKSSMDAVERADLIEPEAQDGDDQDDSEDDDADL